MNKSDKKKAIFCWSGGKDSAFALYKILQEKEYELTALFTTINENFKRVSMHGVREELVEEQSKSIGIPLIKMYVKGGSNDEYERKMEAFLLEQKAKGVEYVIFGDIFLEDLRAYRDKNLEKVGMKGVYPLWKMNTTELANDFIELGFKTILCCTNDAYLGEKEVGTLFSVDFLGGLIGPPGTSWTSNASLAGTPVLLSTSDVDEWVPLDRVKETADVFRAMGADVHLRVCPGRGHLVSDEEIHAAREQLVTLLENAGVR